VILVHRLRGEPLFLNADLIECIEATPDTVVTLADGRKYVVGETPDEIVDKTRHFRASVLVAADELRRSSAGLAQVVALPRRPEDAHPGPSAP
jgi:flagellar protein FlbD